MWPWDLFCRGQRSHRADGREVRPSPCSMSMRYLWPLAFPHRWEHTAQCKFGLYWHNVVTNMAQYGLPSKVEPLLWNKSWRSIIRTKLPIYTPAYLSYVSTDTQSPWARCVGVSWSFLPNENKLLLTYLHLLEYKTKHILMQEKKSLIQFLHKLINFSVMYISVKQIKDKKHLIKMHT